MQMCTPIKLKFGTLKQASKVHLCTKFGGNPIKIHRVMNNCLCKIRSNPNSQAVKKECGSQKGYGEKRCEIQGGGQEMAVMVG